MLQNFCKLACSRVGGHQLVAFVDFFPTFGAQPSQPGANLASSPAFILGAGVGIPVIAYDNLGGGIYYDADGGGISSGFVLIATVSSPGTGPFFTPNYEIVA